MYRPRWMRRLGAWLMGYDAADVGWQPVTIEHLWVDGRSYTRRDPSVVADIDWSVPTVTARLEQDGSVWVLDEDESSTTP